MDLASATFNNRQHEVARTNESSAVADICCALIFAKQVACECLGLSHSQSRSGRQLEDTNADSSWAKWLWLAVSALQDRAAEVMSQPLVCDFFVPSYRILPNSTIVIARGRR